jgi:hypothetical protein
MMIIIIKTKTFFIDKILNLKTMYIYIFKENLVLREEIN